MSTNRELEDGLAEGSDVLGGCEEGLHLVGEERPGGFDGLGVGGIAKGVEGGVAGGAAEGVAGGVGGFEAVEEAHERIDAGDDAVLFGQRRDRDNMIQKGPTVDVSHHQPMRVITVCHVPNGLTKEPKQETVDCQ
jgi:hypothetical protein